MEKVLYCLNINFLVLLLLVIISLNTEAGPLESKLPGSNKNNSY